MGKIKEGTNKYRTITTVLTATFMGKHNYAYMNILMNMPFQKQNNLTNLKGPLYRCYFQSHFCIGKWRNTHYSEFFITFYAKVLSKDILSYFIWRYTSFIFLYHWQWLNPRLLLCALGDLLPAQHTQRARESSQGSERDSRKDKLFSTGMSFKQPHFHLNMEFPSGKLWLRYRLYSIIRIECLEETSHHT